MLEFDEIDELLGLASGVEGNLRYEGTWLDNCRDGVGIAIYPNGDKFEGKINFFTVFWKSLKKSHFCNIASEAS